MHKPCAECAGWSGLVTTLQQVCFMRVGHTCHTFMPNLAQPEHASPDLTGSTADLQKMHRRSLSVSFSSFSLCDDRPGVTKAYHFFQGLNSF